MSKYFRQILSLARRAILSEVGAFSITNKLFLSGVEAYLPAQGTANTGPHHEFADLAMVSGTVTSSTIDTGVVGLKWIRVRALFKTLTGLVAGDSVSITVQAGTGAAITAPTNIIFAESVMRTGDTAILLDRVGWSNAGFQSYAVLLNSSSATTTTVADVMVDCT